MDERELTRYTLTLRAGPGLPDASVDIIYYDANDRCIGTYSETMSAFATTWKDVATVIQQGLHHHKCDVSHCATPSPMVDLT